MSDWVRPVRHGWVVRGAVPGPDVDEFADPDRVTAALAAPGAAEGTLLAVQHPHRTPAALVGGLGLTAALPIARAALERLQTEHYRPVTDVIAPYSVDGPDGTAFGLLCVADPAAVGTDGQAYVRHTEEVYPDVVAERAAVLSGLGCATSAAMLVPAGDGRRLTDLIVELCGELGEPVVSTLDSGGRRHRMWLLGAGARQDEILAVAQEQPLLVADGNHRVAAAAAAGHGSLLALVTGGPGLRIGSINRVLSGTGLSLDEMARRWRAIGLDVRPSTPRDLAAKGEVVVVAGNDAVRVLLPESAERGPVIDHGVVEQVLVKQALGVDPDGPSLRALPGGQAVGDAADAVILLAPVPFDDVLAVHDAGKRMPRKATYFTPKPRSGLLLADL
ncbi:MAG: hypothetical protein JWQ81_6837 [Amycolatopsis sp.]|uniref:DUF1015 family protein n=1 Tax=Amycolatopsis sp. TaxID=37632 RepID=UPI0026117CE1|nr:DUF1015 family protein [Amycolatopsis sp.]MCU1686098.1 hypothetical protein [Amycolatopsis sp.]